MSSSVILPFLKLSLLHILVGMLLLWVLRSWKHDLSWQRLLLAFGLKIIAGAVYGYLFLHFYNGDDTWAYHYESLKQYQLLATDPALFFREMLPENTLSYYPDTLQGLAFYANRIEEWCITKPFALLHWITGGNYYVNVIFYNFVSLIGLLLLYRLYVSYMPEKHLWIYVILFLFPPTLFWLSGIRGDGYLVTVISVMLYYFDRWMKELKYRHLLWVILGMLFILILRGYLLLLFVPMLISWWLIVRKRFSMQRSIALVYGTVLGGFIVSGILPEPLNLWHVLQEKQVAFIALRGNTRFDLTVLDGSLMGLLKVLPEAISHTFFRPTLWEARGPLQAWAALDVLGLFFMILWVLYQQWKEGWKIHVPALMMLLMITGVLLYLFIGYTVPFPGAIVRYKIAGELFILLGILGFRPKKKSI